MVAELALGVVAGLQAVCMAVDEFYCHWRRGLPLWERWGHPVDSLCFLAALLWAVVQPADAAAVGVYIGLSALSCLIITKDEWVHVRLCDAFESWLHACLFVLHPLVLVGVGWLWTSGGSMWLPLLLAGGVALFAVYQVVYWLMYAPRPRTLERLPLRQRLAQRMAQLDDQAKRTRYARS